MRYFFLALLWASSASALQGQLQSITDYYPVNLGPPTEMLVPRLGVELEDQEKVKKSLSFSFKGTFDSNLVSKYQPESYFGDIQEGYGEWKSSHSKIRLGWNTLNWGVLDVYSPMDVVNQRVFFNPIDPAKRGAPMAELQWNPSGWAMSAVYIPWQAKAMLPSVDSRWLPRQSLLNLQDSGGTFLLPSNPQYEYGPTTQLNKALENNYGVNIVKHWTSFDLHLMYFNGTASSPSVNVSMPPGSLITFNGNIVQLAGTITLLPLYYRTQTTGLGFSTTWGPVIIRGESAYMDTISSTSGGVFSPWNWQNGIGIEKNLDLGTTTLTAVLQYYNGKYPKEADNLISSRIRLFDNTPIAGLHWALSDDKTVYGMVFYEIPQDAMILVVGYQAKLTDSLHWDVSWRELTASKPGLIQTYDDDNHADMKLTYYF